MYKFILTLTLSCDKFVNLENRIQCAGSTFFLLRQKRSVWDAQGTLSLDLRQTDRCHTTQGKDLYFHSAVPSFKQVGTVWQNVKRPVPSIFTPFYTSNPSFFFFFFFTSAVLQLPLSFTIYSNQVRGQQQRFWASKKLTCSPVPLEQHIASFLVSKKWCNMLNFYHTDSQSSILCKAVYSI